MCSFNDCSVGVPVNHDKVVHPFVGEEFRTDALKGVGERGALGCEGAMRLQCSQLALKDAMAGVMPGQNTVDSACTILEYKHLDVRNVALQGCVVGVRVV